MPVVGALGVFHDPLSGPVADQQVLQGIAATLSWQNVDQNGEAAAPAGAVTVEVQKANGDAVLGAGTPTVGTSTDPRTVTLVPAQTADLDFLTATWTDAGDGSATQTTVEVVGRYYLSIAELRALPNLGDATKFPVDRLVEARRWFEDKFERYTGLSWVPRFGRSQLSSQVGGPTVWLPVPFPRVVRSVRVYRDGLTFSTFTSTELADLFVGEAGTITRRFLGGWAMGEGNLVVEYEHGRDQPARAVREAAKVAIRDHLIDSVAGEPLRNRQLSTITGEGVVRSSFPGPDHPFGIPFVDQVANSHREFVA